MKANFWKKSYALLSKIDSDKDEDLHLTLMLFVASAFASVMHLTLLVVFLVSRVYWMALVNVCSVVLYSLSFYQIRHKRFAASGLIISGEVIVYVALSAFLIGNAVYTILYLFLLLTLQFTMPYSTFRVRLVVIICLWACMIVSLLKGAYFPPLFSITAVTEAVLKGINTNFTFLGTVTLLTIGNIIKRFIDSFHQLHLHNLEQQAYTDPLTGLYNRRYADHSFEKMRADDTSPVWCVALLDIDDFKYVNDTYGHAMGDVVLAQISNIMRRSLRKTDQLFRWGGEEFLLLLENVDLDTGKRILDKLKYNIGTTDIPLGDNTIRVTATIGVEAVDLEDIAGSIDRCDQKMYHGKQSGKNMVVA